MLVIKRRRNKRQLGIALVLLGVSFAIQMVPPILHRWANMIGASDDVWMEVIWAVYLLLLAIALVRGQPAGSAVSVRPTHR
jgi:ABC-type multidrug transport system fused ATPase/permease subunit